MFRVIQSLIVAGNCSNSDNQGFQIKIIILLKDLAFGVNSPLVGYSLFNSRRQSAIADVNADVIRLFPLSRRQKTNEYFFP